MHLVVIGRGIFFFLFGRNGSGLYSVEPMQLDVARY